MYVLEKINLQVYFLCFKMCTFERFALQHQKEEKKLVFSQEE